MAVLYCTGIFIVRVKRHLFLVDVLLGMLPKLNCHILDSRWKSSLENELQLYIYILQLKYTWSWLTSKWILGALETPMTPQQEQELIQCTKPAMRGEPCNDDLRRFVQLLETLGRAVRQHFTMLNSWRIEFVRACKQFFKNYPSIKNHQTIKESQSQ